MTNEPKTKEVLSKYLSERGRHVYENPDILDSTLAKYANNMYNKDTNPKVRNLNILFFISTSVNYFTVLFYTFKLLNSHKASQ